MSLESARRASSSVLAVVLPLFVLVEVNRPHFSPHGQLVVFAGLGLTLIFLQKRSGEASFWLRLSDFGLASATLAVGVYLLIQTEPWFSGLWWGEQSLGARAGAEPTGDLIVGGVGLVLVLEATRRSLGWALPVLSLVFLLYGRFGSALPDALMPHRGYGWERLVSQTFLHSQGVFGVALQVMLVYVFLFLLFGALLEATGATGYVLDVTRRLFRGRSGGSAKVAVLSSGLLGSLSGSAVANTATTGTFTIPMMRSAGFTPQTAAGLEAAASSGGALVPPVMGAGAYMMLEIINPPVTYLEILRAALLPAILYYLALFWIVHWRALRIEAEGRLRETAGEGVADEEVLGKGDTAGGLWRFEGLIFATGLGWLLVFLLVGFSVFRSVTLAALGAWALSFLSSRTRLSGRDLLGVLKRSSESGVALIAAAASVGVVLGVVTLTGLGSRLPALLLPLAEQNLLGALAALMVSSIVLGMGLPSAVCYLLLATLVGPVLGDLGVVPLAAHLFIFYFGMMSMVTPPVALAAYAASSIAGSPLMPTAFAAFRFALVGFTLPYLFVFRPQLLMLEPSGAVASWGAVVLAFVVVALGIAPFAAAIAGWLQGRLAPWTRGVLYLSAALALFPGEGPVFRSAHVSVWNLLGIGLFVGVYTFQFLRTRSSGG